MPQDYTSRLRIPLAGDNERKFYSKSGALVAKGYRRIVIGGRGPYIEFDGYHIVLHSLADVPGSHYYYEEFRTIPDGVKVYHQLRTVEYADYVPSLYYVSPFDLVTDDGIIVEPLQKKQLELFK